MKKKIVKCIPSIMTLANLFLGFSSILASIQTVNDLYLTALPGGVAHEGNPEAYLAFAGVSILFCTLFDFLDGFFARLFNVAGKLGEQLDSLTDLVSFGLAPGVLFFTVTMIVTGVIPESGIFYRASDFIPEVLVSSLVVFKIFAFIFPTCAIIRLARFNVKEPNLYYFEGLPSTFAGGMVAVFLTFNFYITPAGMLVQFFGWQAPSGVMAVLNFFQWFFQNYLFLFFSYAVIAFLMVSNVKFIKIINFIRPILNKKKIHWLFIHIFLLVIFFKYYLLIIGLSYLFLANSIVQRKNPIFLKPN